MSITDEQVKALAHSHSNGRYPVASWMHRNGAILMHSSSLRSKTANVLFKQSQGKSKFLSRTAHSKERIGYY